MKIIQFIDQAENKVRLQIVVVTYNRCELLEKVLSRLLQISNYKVEKVWVCDNASTDNTQDVIKIMQDRDDRVQNIRLDTNRGGAGGFCAGMQAAYNDGADWIGLMDDDLIIEENSIDVISKYFSEEKCLTVVRENKAGGLEEFAATKYDLKSVFRINPKVTSVLSEYKTRENCPKIFDIDCGSFEGFFVSRDVVSTVGFPRPDYFIYGDDFDYSIRIRKKGIRIKAVRDAKGIRQLPYKKAGFNSWKTYWVWRNFFILHFLYGENIIIRAKPFVFTIGLCLMLFPYTKNNPFRILFDAIKTSKKLKKENEKAEDLVV